MREYRKGKRQGTETMKKQFQPCEVCGSPKATVRCQYCKKWLCDQCYGTWSEARKCCGREDEIFQKTRQEAARQ